MNKTGNPQIVRYSKKADSEMPFVLTRKASSARKVSATHTDVVSFLQLFPLFDCLFACLLLCLFLFFVCLLVCMFPYILVCFFAGFLLFVWFVCMFVFVCILFICLFPRLLVCLFVCILFVCLFLFDCFFGCFFVT